MQIYYLSTTGLQPLEPGTNTSVTLAVTFRSCHMGFRTLLPYAERKQGHVINAVKAAASIIIPTRPELCMFLLLVTLDILK